jgi:hypothetical protein
MTKAPDDLTAVDPADLTGAVHYALRFGLNGKPHGKKIRADAEWMAQHIVTHLARANFHVMVGPPARAPCTGRLMGDTDHTRG